MQDVNEDVRSEVARYEDARREDVRCEDARCEDIWFQLFLEELCVQALSGTKAPCVAAFRPGQQWLAVSCSWPQTAGHGDQVQGLTGKLCSKVCFKKVMTYSIINEWQYYGKIWQ